MKIIRCDNFDRDHIPDELVADNISSKIEAEIMLRALQAKNSDPNDPTWYKLVEDDYELKKEIEDHA